MRATTDSAETFAVGFPWVVRHAAALAAVAIALAGTAAVFTFARPTYHPAAESLVVHMATRKHYSVAELRQAFHRQRIELVQTAKLGEGGAVFTDRHPGNTDDSFTATLYGPNAVVLWATTIPNPPLYDRRQGNLWAVYGGHSKAFASRVAAAFDALVRH